MAQPRGPFLRPLIAWLLGACAHPGPPVAAPTAEVPTRAAASVPPSRAHSWYLRARVAEGLGDEAMAARGASWARRLDPDDPALAELLIAGADRQDDPELALELALDALDAAPDVRPCERAFAHRGAAWAWLDLDHAGDAARHLTALAEDGCPEPEGEIAVAMRRGDPEAARAWLRAWAPREAGERLAAAGWALELEHPGHAVRWLAPLTGHPSHPEAASLLARAAETHPEAVRTLLERSAPLAGGRWAELLDRLEAP